MRKIIITIPEESSIYFNGIPVFLKQFPDVVDFSRIPHGKKTKAIRLLLRALTSATDTQKNYEDWKTIIMELKSLDSERSKFRMVMDKEGKELNALKCFAKRYSEIEAPGAIKEVESRYKFIKKEIAKLEIKINELKEKLPKFLRYRSYWWGY